MLPDPLSGNMIQVRAAVDRLVEHVSPALDLLGDTNMVADTIERVFSSGNGAVHQRRVFRRDGFGAVVDHLAARTIADRL